MHVFLIKPSQVGNENDKMKEKESRDMFGSSPTYATTTGLLDHNF